MAYNEAMIFAVYIRNMHVLYSNGNYKGLA